MMINRIFIVSTQNVGTNAFAVSDETHFCIEVNPADNNDMSNAYQLMSATGNNLSLFLAIHDLLSETSLHSILSFLFLPTYNQSHRSPVIHLTGESDELVNRSIHLLSEAIKEQGFENFVVEKVPADILFESTEAIIAHYKEVLRSEVFFGNNLFLKSNETKQIELTIAAMKDLEFSFAKSNPKLYTLAKQLVDIKKENNRLTQEHTIISEELANQKEYADILRSSHSARRLQEYYTAEYEVLPTWYKRVGHIIKVVTGKRSFKSLFDDREKNQQS